MNAVLASETEIIDGYVIDVTTGEVLGLAQPPAFQINDDSSLDWVMGKMLGEEAAMHEIDNTAIVVQARAILENAAKMKSERAKRLSWLHTRFDEEIAAFVKPKLEGVKTKTWKTLYGSVAFRNKPGGLRVLDESAALAAARLGFPEAIKKTEVFQISRLLPEQVISLTTGLLDTVWTEDDLARKAFTVLPDSETCTVKTSVEK